MKDLCTLAKKFGVRSIAVTDINNTSACMSLIKTAQKNGINPTHRYRFSEWYAAAIRRIGKEHDILFHDAQSIIDFLLQLRS